MISLILIITTFLIGCQEMESVKTDKEKNVYLEASEVALKDSDLIYHRNGDRIVQVEVKYLFRNLLNEQVKLKILCEFYDKNDNLLYIGGPKYINLLPLYSEQDYLGPNSIVYDGDNCELVNYIIIKTQRIN